MSVGGRPRAALGRAMASSFLQWRRPRVKAGDIWISGCVSRDRGGRRLGKAEARGERLRLPRPRRGRRQAREQVADGEGVLKERERETEGIDECGSLGTGQDRRRRLVTHGATEKQEKTR
jgi:hypothetical protein